MPDPNMADFYGRVARLQKARAKGYGFEASGTLGRSYYPMPARKRRSFLGSVLILMICGFLLKGVMYQQFGVQTYTARVIGLVSGEGVDRVGGWLMQADPVTVYIAGKVDLLLRKAK